MMQGRNSMDLDTFLSYWSHPHRVMWGRHKGRPLGEGIIIWLMLHPSTVVESFDMLAPMKEDHPHLAHMLDDFEFITLKRISFSIEAIPDMLAAAGSLPEEIVNEFHEYVSDHSATDPDSGISVWSEYMQASSKKGGLIAGDTSQSTTDILLDAFNHTARTRGLSIIMDEADGIVTSISSGPGRGAPKVEKLLGNKMIEQQVAEFRQSIDSWMPKGGDDK